MTPTSTVEPVARACVVCGRFTGHEYRFSGRVWRCGSCGFAWTVAAIAEPEELYDEAYFQGQGYEDYYVPAARRFEAGRRLRWLLAGGRPASLLEAGSAAGFFVEAARRAGIAAEGIEVAGSAARYAREELGVPVRHGCFEDEVFTTPYDVVCAFHVLEHVEDPREFLAAARRAVIPGGRVVLEVPNIASGAALRLGLAWTGLELAHHRWHFTPESLARLVTTLGFEVVAMDTTVFRYYMPLRYRLRHLGALLPSDLLSLRSPGLTHPHRGDLLRLVAVRPQGTRPYYLHPQGTHRMTRGGR
jgi:SAM-dependent methyltransferase